MRGCEVQDGKRRDDGNGRMGLHDHVILRTCHALDERLIRRLAMQAGYGHSVEMDEMAPDSRREASYVSKYISKSADQRWDVPWRTDVVNTETGEVIRKLVKARYRTWSTSRSWGVTMKQLKAEAAIRARSLASGERDDERTAILLLKAVLDATDGESGDSPPAPS